MREQSQTRILVKTLAYRILVLSITFCASLYITGDFKKAIGFSVGLEFLQMLVYYMYEQIWNNIEWGLTSKKDTEDFVIL